MPPWQSAEATVAREARDDDTEIESGRVSRVSLDRDDRGDPLVAIHPAQKHGVNAEERYGLQKYRFPITDSGRLARTAVHRHPPRCPSPTWTGHRNNTATACAKGCPLLPDPLAPTVPPLSPFVSVARFTLDASFFSRESAHSPALSIPPMGSSFFSSLDPYDPMCTTGPRV